MHSFKARTHTRTQHMSYAHSAGLVPAVTHEAKEILMALSTLSHAVTRSNSLASSLRFNSIDLKPKPRRNKEKKYLKKCGLGEQLSDVWTVPTQGCFGFILICDKQESHQCERNYRTPPPLPKQLSGYYDRFRNCLV